MQESQTITRVTTRIAVAIAALIAVVLPVGYYTLAYNHMSGSLEAEVEIMADTVSDEIGKNPQIWRYEESRFEGMISLHLGDSAYDESVKILDEGSEVVARQVHRTAKPPFIVRTARLFDAGVPVGRIEIQGTLRPLLIKTAFVALLGLIMGLAVFITLRVLPLRAVYNAEASLRKSRGDLEKLTVELTWTNKELLKEITARKEVEEQLVHNALHDALTGIPNRALFMERLTHAMAIANRRPDYSYAVLFIDLDIFKVINDSLGHLVGDQLLIAIGQRLSACLRPGDTVARLGGDEFAILLEDIKDPALCRKFLARA